MSIWKHYLTYSVGDEVSEKYINRSKENNDLVWQGKINMSFQFDVNTCNFTNQKKIILIN